jgi:hypothetical protein
VRIVIEFWLLVVLLTGLPLGILGILWERMGRENGKRIFIAAMFVLGGGSVYGAIHRADALAPLGLAAVALVVAMLWGDPRAIEPTPFVEP